MTQNEQLAHDGYEAVMRGELEALEDLLAPDLTWHWWEHGPGTATAARRRLP
jgi:ketosteroid isomerase-like protein